MGAETPLPTHTPLTLGLVLMLSPEPVWGAVLSPGCPLPSSSLQSLSSSPQAQPPRPAELSDEEVAELFQRLAETQQEKWMLEEKVLPACLFLHGQQAGTGWLMFGRPLLMWEHAQSRV